MNRNNTTLTCILNNTGPDLIVWRLGAFLFPMLGLPGHVLMVLTILNTDRRNFHPTSLYFIFMSVVESIYLLFLFWDWLDVVNLAPDPRRILNCAYFYPFVNGAALISLVLLVFLLLDQISMINHPQKSHPKITNQRIVIKIFLTYTIFIFLFIHFRFSLKYSQQSFTIYGQSCCVYERAHQWFYNIWPYIQLVARLIPCLIIILCTFYVCLNRYETTSGYARSSSNSIHRQQQTLSVVLVCVSLYTLCAVIPISILQLFNHRMHQYEIDYRYSCSSNSTKANQWKFFNALLIMWEASAYMNKFYIKFFVSVQFRNDVKQMIFQRWNYSRTFSNRH